MVKESNRGQIALIILLFMAVILTIGISVATRTTEDVSVSRKEEETTRVFNAAEAGIESALGLATPLPDLPYIGDVYNPAPYTFSVPDSLTYDYQIEKDDILEVIVPQGNTIDVNVSGVSGTDGLWIDWGEPTAGCSAGGIVVAIYNAAGPTVRRWGFIGAGCVSGDNFIDTFVIAPPGSAWRLALGFGLVPGFTSNDVLLRIRATYADMPIRITPRGGWVASFPPQQYNIESEGTKALTGETRAILTTRTNPFIPSIFDYVVFSGSSLIQ